MKADLERTNFPSHYATSNSDLSQTSHCNMKGISVREVMRIENMITQVKFYDILTASPHYFCKKCTETKENLLFDSRV